jgi:misacylated tRNA(Ala) deacylase
MKNYSDPRMHSAEHILNQTMVRSFDCGRSFSAHIEKKKSKCDYHFDRPLEDKEIRTIENQVNEVIGRDLPVSEEFLTRDEAAHLYSLEKLPESAGERIRIVKVGDYDACPCIGEHVVSTKEIGEFRITSASHQDGVLRIRFKVSTEK